MNRKHTILIVDDDAAAINLAIFHFEKAKADYEFLQARDVESGYKIAMNELPDLIVLDWEMPGLSGIDMLNLLKKETATAIIPVIMVTGVMTNTENLFTAFDAGVIDYLQKPVDANQLIARTRSMLMLSDAYKETIELKKRELLSFATTHAQQNEFHLNLIKQLKKLSVEHGTKNRKLDAALQEIISDIQQQTKHDAWTKFETYYQQVSPDFFNILTNRFSNLTPAEIKLAALLRLNLDTKEIAAITFQDPDSVRVARTRLRKKLNLETGDNLTNFLLSIQ